MRAAPSRFTGAATGSDFADFLLGIPHTSSIAFGNADKRLRAIVVRRLRQRRLARRAALTLNAGVRWEYETPITEQSAGW